MLNLNLFVNMRKILRVFNPEEVEEYLLDVPEEFEGSRLDQWLASVFTDSSRSQIKQWVEKGFVEVEGKTVNKNSYSLKTGQKVHVKIRTVPENSLTPAPLELDILFEDEHLIVVNKAAGIVVHPGAGVHSTTLVEGILHYLGKEAPSGATRPGIVHRLDKDTSGAIVVAKNDVVHRGLAEQFANKSNFREYVAILNGTLDGLAGGKVEYESYLYRDPAHRLRFASMPAAEYQAKFSEVEPKGYRYAKSTFEVQGEFKSRISLSYVRLHTGRTHQIRVHAKALGAAVLGDGLYGLAPTLPKAFGEEAAKAVLAVKRQMLHARFLGFTHPATGKVERFEAPLPGDMQSLLRVLSPHLDS